MMVLKMQMRRGNETMQKVGGDKHNKRRKRCAHIKKRKRQNQDFNNISLVKLGVKACSPQNMGVGARVLQKYVLPSHTSECA